MVRKLLITAIVILSLTLTALLGFIWYQSTHFFVDGMAYANNLQELDLRDTEISEDHFLQVQSRLPDCRIYWNVPFQGNYYPSDSNQLTIQELTTEDLRIMKNYFTDLQLIDATDCTDYAMLAELTEQLPQCNVAYQIVLGKSSVDPGAQDLTLETGAYDFDTLMSNLPYLTQLKSIHFPACQLSLEQKAQLRETFPDAVITTTVEILGQQYDDATTELDLSAMTAADVEAVAAQLSMLPQLTKVHLSSGETSSPLTLAEVKILKNAAPNATISHAFQFYGINVTTEDEEVNLKRITVEDGDNFPQQLRDLLDVLGNCKRLVLDDKGPYDKLWKYISDEELAQIREEYRDRTKVVWRVYFGENGSSLTDVQVLRAVYGLTDDNSKDLRYCENVRYLDVGHNEFLDYVDFLEGMTELEVAILSGAPLKDLTPVGSCKNLKFLEIANCQYLPDISVLKNCTKLEMLNIGFTKFTDMSVLNELNLTHLTAVRSSFVYRSEPKEELEEFIAAHPHCWVVYEGDQPYGTGWRYDESGKHLPWYASMVEAFGYPNPNNNVGWYLKEE